MVVKKICIIRQYHCQHNQPRHVTSKKKKKNPCHVYNYKQLLFLNWKV